MCVSRRGSGPSGTVFISLCEDTAELILRWKATGMFSSTMVLVCMLSMYMYMHIGITETVDLLQVKARKGFSHRGRLNSG